MASSLNRIFAKKIDPRYAVEEEDDDDFQGFDCGDSGSGSETESISMDGVSESEDDCSRPVAKKGRVSAGNGSGVAPGDKKLMRNPTRRPNPKISNRNALLARENRRRKKEHVENLEKEVEALKECNEKMRKVLKKRSKLVARLTQERNYLKSVIANRSGIMSVLKAIQRSGIPMTSSNLSYVKEPIKTPSSDEGFGSSPYPEDKFNDHDADLGMMVSHEHRAVSFEEEFSRLPDVDELLSTMAGNSSSSSPEQVGRTEASAFTSCLGAACRSSFAPPAR